ncbi:alpha-acetolactate decarboxylase [Dothidotthia symphoricarpi CBS 119687]|uniref:Alpha-acetolactate decarboxylase n=1 Tax=Dothidotthia symphoricarpi CBS 119687 TaxID=1392245 RepID=A0A6A6A0W4_9PLEO|nr:alpha-acetolactate decarboxylase [Dothidotthia symphoricarpi CBS 119687]KAF2125489.1 alpha-acetolactate decarboxylase [Dothidotthia symphoricarpi CBS 119687]
MVASIPNDIFQFSTHSALAAGFNTGQPRTSDLTSHGTDGVGVYEDGSLLMLRDGDAYAIAKDGTANVAPMNARLPFAMVTTFAPSHRMAIPEIDMDALDDLATSSSLFQEIHMQSVNTLMPFKITGKFKSIDYLDGTSGSAIVHGVIFGFVVPKWMKAISGPRIHAHFLDMHGKMGGKVVDFDTTEDATLCFARCGRFHLGFPQGGEWEEVRL